MNETKYIDAEVYEGGNNEGLSFREIILVHIRRISALQSKEMRGGYWQTKRRPIGSGQFLDEKFYVPDSREEFGGAVSFLHDVLLPHFDDELKKKSQSINSELNQIRKLFYVKVTGKIEDEKLSELCDLLPSDNYKDDKKLNAEQYRFIRLRLNRSLFQELSKFLYRKNYLESSYLDEEA